MNPDIALKKLVEGNKHYVENTTKGAELTIATKRQNVADGQSPFAIIVGCADSRVPAELVFHQGLGDLFVIRVAGNVVAPSQIGSVEFACQNFGTRLVVVLGHSHCGAVKATIEAIAGNIDDISPNVASIVDRVKPAVQPIVEHQQFSDHDDLVHQAMRANVEQSVNDLQNHSPILQSMAANGEIKIIGAEYSLETGLVDFYLDD